MSDSYVTLRPNGEVSGYIGHDAVQLASVTILRAAIRLHMNAGIIPTRGMTITRMLQSASLITHKKYKRSQHQRAIDDLTLWIEAMKSALPRVQG